MHRFRQLLKPGLVSVRRVGVDAEPLSLRFGGMLCWSDDTTNDQKVIKQIVRFYPVDPEPPNTVFASAVIQDNTAVLAIEASHKLNALVDELKRSGVLSEETASGFKIALQATNIEKSVIEDWWWRLDKVTDASEYL